MNEVKNMEQTKPTRFILGCIAVLVASYVIGLGIRGIRFRNVAASETTIEAEEPSTATQTEQPAPTLGSGAPERARGGTQEQGTMGRGEFDSTFQEGMTQRGGRTRGGGFQDLSEEERTQMMESFQNMPEEGFQMRGGRGGGRGTRGGRGGGGRGDFGGGLGGQDFGGGDFSGQDAGQEDFEPIE